jgi:aryl-alcohol dehydrogenase-like predicted oxidoreductase
MRFTGPGIIGPPADRDQCRRVAQRAVALGVNFIDTADSYGPERAENVIQEALCPYPKGLVIATKGGFVHTSLDTWVERGRPDHLRKACDSSLKRLKVERIDLYQLHVPDPKVPYAESIGALREFQKEGKIRHIGVSNVTLQQLEEARSQVKVVSVQNPFNVVYRENEDVLEFCAQEGIAFIAWMPLADKLQFYRVHPDPRSLEAALLRAAARYQRSTPQVMLAALLQRSPVIIPIPGTGSLDHLVENVAAADLHLDS